MKTRLSLLAVLAASALPASGQGTFRLEQRLVAPDYEFPSARYGFDSEQEFGTSVVSGDCAAIGMTGFLSGHFGRARVAIFERSGGVWGPATEIRTFEDQFTGEVHFDLEGDTLVVGDPRHTVGGVGQAGAVFVYRRDPVTGAWQQVARIDPPTPTAIGRFGETLRLSGDTLGVHEALNAGQGPIHVFERDLGGPEAWGLRQTLLPPPGNTSHLLGALEGNLLLVSRRDNTSGYLEVHERSGPGQAFEEAATFPLGYSGYVGVVTDGQRIAGTRLIAGTTNATIRFFDKDEDGWIERPSLQQPLPQNAQFGLSALQGSTLLASAFQSVGGPDASGVYVYEQDPGSPSGWTLHEVVTEPDASYGEMYASGASLSGTTLFVAAIQSSTAGPYAGEVYVYARVP